MPRLLGLVSKTDKVLAAVQVNESNDYPLDAALSELFVELCETQDLRLMVTHIKKGDGDGKRQ
jgi:hypothetical protein